MNVESPKQGTGWGELPTVVLVEIYKNLKSRRDRLSAAIVCKNWRLPAFQVPLSDTLHLSMWNGERDMSRINFLSHQFINKVQNVSFVFDVTTPECLNMVEKVILLLGNNQSLKNLKFTCTDHCLAYLQKVEDVMFVEKVLDPLMTVLKKQQHLETFSFPLIQNVACLTGQKMLSTLMNSRSNYSVSNLFLPSLKHAQSPAPFHYGIPELVGTHTLFKLQMLSIGYEYLNDDVLGVLGRDNTTGGLKRLSLVAVMGSASVSNRGWSLFSNNNPQCKVRLTVSGGIGLLTHASNLVFPSIPLSHFRAYQSKELRITFLNALIGWNLETLEHLELMDADLNFMDILAHHEPDENQFLDPIVYAAWRCKLLHTIKLGIHYCGDSLVGIARLKGSDLQMLEIPKACVIVNSLNIRKLSKEISSALGRPWKPIDSLTKYRVRRHRKSVLHLGPTMTETLRATRTDEL